MLIPCSAKIDDDVLLADEVGEPGIRRDLDPADRHADLVVVGVDDRGDVDPVLGEDRGDRKSVV